MFKEELEKFSKELETYLTTSNSIAIALLDADFAVLDCNLGFMRMFNPRQHPAGKPLREFLDLEDADIRYSEEFRVPCSRSTGIGGIVYCYLIRKENSQLLVCERVVITESRALEQIGIVNDELINLQRELVKKNRLLENLKRELDGRIVELESALDKIRQMESCTV
jgi:PAS domain-containing protein